ncbi:hypothetical protein G9F72_024105 [Clostridium estertheticum]|uniref:hypothetical protein n=1 Tax=Clostridium estertheticum TaxID=238834 RepID=UPI0013E9374F|nr:hypothetical protein [Clostridium estertheticum]MBZ9689385.1 hypothetical protein [Clostridium estertheticum]
MSKGNSRKELLFGIFTKHNPGRIEKAIGTRLYSIQLERNFIGVDGKQRRVDMCATDKAGTRRYFIEFSLKSIDESHFIQLKKLIYMAKKIQKTVVISCATSINKRYFDELGRIVSLSSNKNIEFMFIRLNTEQIVPILEEINKLHHLEQVPILKRLDNEVEEHYKSVKGVKCYNNIETISVQVNDSEKYSNKKTTLLLILKRLRNECEYANVYKYKELNSNSFEIGSSTTDINYQVLFDRAGRLGIQLVFQINAKPIFCELLNMRDEIDDKMDYIILWKMQRIVTYFSERNYTDKETMIKAMCRVIKKYLFTLDSYLNRAVKGHKGID